METGGFCFLSLFDLETIFGDRRQEQTTKDAIKKSFQDTGITPFKDGEWKKYVETSFQTQGAPAASHILHKVHKLQQKNAISAYLFKLGLDNQNPED